MISKIVVAGQQLSGSLVPWRRAIIASHYARVAAYGTKFLYFGMPESTPIPPVFDLQI
jgi:hypothetical protein